MRPPALSRYKHRQHDRWGRGIWTDGDLAQGGGLGGGVSVGRELGCLPLARSLRELRPSSAQEGGRRHLDGRGSRSGRGVGWWRVGWERAGLSTAGEVTERATTIVSTGGGAPASGRTGISLRAGVGWWRLGWERAGLFAAGEVTERATTIVSTGGGRRHLDGRGSRSGRGLGGGVSVGRELGCSPLARSLRELD